jgi:hypothetical protein
MRIAISVALIAALTSACSLETSTDPNIGPSKKAAGKTGGGKKNAPKDGLHVVVYEMGGTAKKADLTWTTPSGVEQEGDAKVPWKKTLKAEDGTPISISGQNKGGGTITCTITVDGEQVKAAKSKGLYQIASCDGIIGF